MGKSQKASQSSLYRAIESLGVDILNVATKLPRNYAIQQSVAIMVQACNDAKVACSRALYTHDAETKLQWIDELIVQETAITSMFKTWFEWQTRYGGDAHYISHKQHGFFLTLFVKIGAETGSWRNSVMANIKGPSI